MFGRDRPAYLTQRLFFLFFTPFWVLNLDILASRSKYRARGLLNDFKMLPVFFCWLFSFFPEVS